MLLYDQNTDTYKKVKKNRETHNLRQCFFACLNITFQYLTNVHSHMSTKWDSLYYFTILTSLAIRYHGHTIKRNIYPSIFLVQDQRHSPTEGEQHPAYLLA
jgi:hypothetical protein